MDAFARTVRRVLRRAARDPVWQRHRGPAPRDCWARWARATAVTEVITVSHTFGATVEAIASAGYRPVMVDVDPDTYVMDLDQARKAIRTERTVAVVPVHLYGRMVEHAALAGLGRSLWDSP